MSSTRVICVKSKTRCPRSRMRFKSLSSKTILPQFSTKCSPKGGRVRSSTPGNLQNWRSVQNRSIYQLANEIKLSLNDGFTTKNLLYRQIRGKYQLSLARKQASRQCATQTNTSICGVLNMGAQHIFEAALSLTKAEKKIVETICYTSGGQTFFVCMEQHTYLHDNVQNGSSTTRCSSNGFNIPLENISIKLLL